MWQDSNADKTMEQREGSASDNLTAKIISNQIQAEPNPEGQNTECEMKAEIE